MKYLLVHQVKNNSSALINERILFKTQILFEQVNHWRSLHWYSIWLVESYYYLDYFNDQWVYSFLVHRCRCLSQVYLPNCSKNDHLELFSDICIINNWFICWKRKEESWWSVVICMVDWNKFFSSFNHLCYFIDNFIILYSSNWTKK